MNWWRYCSQSTPNYVWTAEQWFTHFHTQRAASAFMTYRESVNTNWHATTHRYLSSWPGAGGTLWGHTRNIVCWLNTLHSCSRWASFGNYKVRFNGKHCMVRGMLELSENLDARAFNRRRDQRIFNEAITYQGGREQMTGAWKDFRC